MLVKLPQTVTGLRSGPEALSEAYRARLRGRTYATAAFNAAPSPETIPVTTRDGVDLRVQAFGPADGEVIVLIHGWSCCIEYWNPQINAFADQYRVVAFDLRGHGASAAGKRAYCAEQLADDLSDVLDAVLRPGQRAVLVGHSMGGITIQAWAQYYPEQVAARASAVLLATTTAGAIASETQVLPIFNALVPAPIWLGRALFGTPVPLPSGSPVRSIFKARILNRAATAEQVDFGLSIVRSCRPTVRGRFALALADLDLTGAAAHLTVPTSVIAGEYDRLLPKRMSERIADVLAETGHLDRYTVLPTGHLPNIEAPQEFNAELHRMVRVGRYGRGAVAS
ncbi:alpha/beta fold hydrolase [Nocardia blacklockiae]|uniref:alpha/beta fold hydrolase n=1 Tax=Nocardia blacklockiae TaxID=480036 RepID=UPI00189468FE|nr:alpha/beta hydrolase [Nocardia blacklockiae]MBF6172932.1 alpha/beta hydrolase [Nocardia blacklockiae]